MPKVTSTVVTTVSVINLQAVQGDDELYFCTVEVYNPTTDKFEPFDLQFTTKIQFTAKDRISQAIVYNTDDDAGGVLAPPYYPNEIIHTDPNIGKFTLGISAVATTLFAIKTYEYDMQITKTGAGKIKTIAQGTLTIGKQITP